MITSITTLM